MHLPTVLITAALTVSALATPAAWGSQPSGHWSKDAWKWGWGQWGQDAKQCLTDDQAQQGSEIFRKLIQEYSTELALEALTEDFVDYTSSVAIIINRGAGGPKSLTAPAFEGRAAFMAAQGSQPQIPFTTLNVFHGCDSIAMRWMTARSAQGQPTEAAQLPVIGNAILSTVPDKSNKYGFRVKTLYSEFNAAAWLVNLGVFKPNGTLIPVKRDAAIDDTMFRGGLI